MKMSMKKFVEIQDEFQGYKVKFKAKRNDGEICYFERIVNDKFCEPSGKFFTILEVEILKHIGITTLKVNDNGAIELKIK